MREHDRTSSTPKSSCAAELSGNPGEGGNPVEDSAVTFSEEKKQMRANNMPTMANLHAFVTESLTKCEGLISLIVSTSSELNLSNPIYPKTQQRNGRLKQLLQGPSTR